MRCVSQGVRTEEAGARPNLEIERVELCSEEHGKQEHYRKVVCEVGGALPFESRPVCGRELAEDAAGLAPNAPRLAEAAPGVSLK